jgi:hypothetical protein
MDGVRTNKTYSSFILSYSHIQDETQIHIA